MLSTELMKQQVLPLFFSPKGRISRGLFWKSNLVLWLGFLSLVFCLIVAEHLVGFSNDLSIKTFMVAIVVYGYAITVLTIKRLHDINWSGWWAVPSIVIGFLWLIVGLIPSKVGENAHGDNLIEYEKNRLNINRGTGLPPPAPPLDNPVSKIILYMMMILPIPSLLVAGVVAPNNINTPTVQTEEVTLDEEESKSEAVLKEEKLPFELKEGDQYQKVEAQDGIDTYYIVTRAEGIIEHYALDGTLQWSNFEADERAIEYTDDLESRPSTQEKSSNVLSYLPFTGEKYFNFYGGNKTEYTIKIFSNGQTEINLCGSDCIVIYNGKYSNPIKLDDGSGFLFQNDKVYALPQTGKLADEGCENYEGDKCVSHLY